MLLQRKRGKKQITYFFGGGVQTVDRPNRKTVNGSVKLAVDSTGTEKLKKIAFVISVQEVLAFSYAGAPVRCFEVTHACCANLLHDNNLVVYVQSKE